MIIDLSLTVINRYIFSNSRSTKQKNPRVHLGISNWTPKIVAAFGRIVEHQHITHVHTLTTCVRPTPYGDNLRLIRGATVQSDIRFVTVPSGPNPLPRRAVQTQSFEFCTDCVTRVSLSHYTRIVSTKRLIILLCIHQTAWLSFVLSRYSPLVYILWFDFRTLKE